MSHNRDEIIINRVAPTDVYTVVKYASVTLDFPPGTQIETKIKKVRQVERLLERLDHESED